MSYIDLCKECYKHNRATSVHTKQMLFCFVCKGYLCEVHCTRLKARLDKEDEAEERNNTAKETTRLDLREAKSRMEVNPLWDG